MYFIIPALVVIVITAMIIAVISDSAESPLLIIVVTLGLLLLLYLIEMVYYTGKPTLVNKSNISVMYDKYVAIVRIGDEYQETFDKKYDYDNIKLGNFIIKKQKDYNIFGDVNDTDYILQIKSK